jgi:Ca2+-binding RTX toxin-like protein
MTAWEASAATLSWIASRRTAHQWATGECAPRYGGNDNLHGSGDSDVIHGGDGADLIHGGVYPDELDGDGGDYLDGGAGSDLVSGGGGDDTMDNPADGARDTFDFGNGYDRCYSGDPPASTSSSTASTRGPRPGPACAERPLADQDGERRDGDRPARPHPRSARSYSATR